MSVHNQMPLRPGGLTLTKQAADAANITSSSCVLDVGCGNGTSLAYLRECYGCSVTGVDLSVSALNVAAANLMASPSDRFDPIASVNLLHTDASLLPVPDTSFDLVMMECTITLFTDPFRTLLEAARVLRPGGWLYISTFIKKRPSSSTQLVTDGLLHPDILCEQLPAMGFAHSSISCTDQSDILIQYVADIIFQYGSLDAFIREATSQNGGCIFNCTAPPKETCYTTILAQKEMTVSPPPATTENTFS